jgi:2-oxo-3-hexenedioate decarboxylase
MFFSRIVVGELMEALDQGKTIPSIVERNPHFDWDQAYRVAADIVRARRARGEQTVGRKIGFTNRNIWAQYGAIAPIWAHVYDRTVQFAQDGKAAVSLKSSVQPRLEPEIAFKLKAPLPPSINDPEWMLEAIEWYAPSFEIVDCHFADWKFGPADSAADFSFHWRLIIGTPCKVETSAIPALVASLGDCRIALSKGDAVVDRGVGANALGHPLTALAHLAGALAQQSQFDPLAAGEIITTGTLTAAMPVKAGETWSSRYEGLPGVTGLTLRFTD